MSTATPTPAEANKKKGLKRLTGIITGKSRRDKKKVKSVGESAVTQQDDGSTIYGAELDGSVAGNSLSTAKNTTIADPVQVILLLMDPSTRKFELLQLEFDSSSAKVSDIYSQIPAAATEGVLKDASYKAMISAKGEKLSDDVMISKFFTEIGVLIAVPESSNDDHQKIATMAVPILTNSKVYKMLTTSGVNTDDLPEKVVKKSKRSPEKTRPLKTIEEKGEEETANYFAVGILAALFIHLFLKAHMFISAPLQPGSTMGLGKNKNSCGLLGSMPFYSCPSPKRVTMGADGVLTVLEGDDVIATFYGKLCASNVDDCIDGVVVQEDGTLLIGGSKAKLKSKSKSKLSPWPFADDVKYKGRR